MKTQYSGLEIAVIGLSGRFPGANNIDTFWSNLKDGVESISFFDDKELLEEGEEEKLINHPAYVKGRAIINDKEFFDSSFFNYRPDEAKMMDPQMRIFHECAWEAIENAGCNLDDDSQKIGLFVGASTNINWVVYSEMLNKEGLMDPFTASQLSNSRFLATKVSYCLNLTGPSIMLDTGCSTSLVAIHQAAKSLLLAECSVAVAGGVNIRNESKKGYLYVEGMTQSRDGHCRTFDAEASGTAGGEGAAVVVLKTLKNALKDGDHIWAIIKGGGVNNDGSSKVGFSAPSIDGQTEAILTAQKRAKVEPESVSFIEAHGTATHLGDPIEVEALNRAFGKSANKYCALGSVKTNIGHLDAAAGAAGFIKTVLALKNKELPPSLNFKSPNPKINFKDSPFYVNTELKKWENDKYPLRAGVSSFGMGGTNAHIVLEEAPELAETSASRSCQLLLVSAKTRSALTRNISNLRNYLEGNSQIKLPDVAYTLQTGRKSFPFRKAIVCNDYNDALTQLASLSVKNNHLPLKEPRPPKVVFMFPGQGAQYRHMCRDLYEKERVFRETVDLCLNIANKFSGKNLWSVIFPANNSEAGINRTENAQPALFIIEYSLAKFLIHWGISPDCMIGHSFGEYVAACISEVFSLEDALYLVIKRGELMQKVSEGKLLGISISEHNLEPYLEQYSDVALATVNATELCVVAGGDVAIADFKAMIERKGYLAKEISGSQAYHSYMMDGILDDFRIVLSSVSFGRPVIPFISNTTGLKAIESDLINPEYWVRHLRQTVQFSKGITTLMEDENVIFIEVGPGVELSIFVRSNAARKAGHKAINLVKHQDVQSDDQAHLLDALGKLWVYGLTPDWKAFYVDEERRKVVLPTYSFDKLKYPAFVNAYKILSDKMREGTLAKEKDISKWFYKPTWKLSSVLPQVFQNAPLKNTAIFCDAVGIGSALAEKYNGEGKVVCIKSGHHFIEESHFAYIINPENPDDYKRLFSRLAALQLLPDCIIHGWAISANTHSNLSEADFVGSFYSLSEIVKALQVQKNLSGVQITQITNNLHPILNKGEIDPIKSMGPALLKVIAQEYQAVTTHIDIDLAAKEEANFIEELWTDLDNAEPGRVISLRQSLRWELIYEKIAVKEQHFDSSFKQGGVYLITGGLGSFGFHLSDYLLKTYNAKLILLGREKLNDESVSTEKLSRLKLLQEYAGNGVLYFNCAITDEQALSAIVQIGERKLGAINGVFHAAGVVQGHSLNFINELQTSHFKEQFEPKIHGLLALSNVFQNRELDFCVLTSSLSPVLGGLGFGAYGPANTFMDYYINSSRKQGKLKNWISMNIDGFNLLEDFETAINKDEIFEVLERVVSLKHLPQVIVSASDLAKRLENAVYKNQIQDSAEVNFKITVSHFDETENESSYSDTQKALLLLWREFFGSGNITPEDDFFELGGDSLKALALIKRINKALNIELTIADFFKNLSIEKLSAYIEADSETKHKVLYTPIPKAIGGNSFTLSPPQQRLYFLYEFDPLSLAYVMPKFIRLKGQLNIGKLSRIFKELVDRHESLRTSFEVINALPVQTISALTEFEVEYYNAEGKDVGLLIKHLTRPFNLREAPLIRVGLIQDASDEYILVLVMHHIITDGVSGGILFKEFMSLYNNESVPELTVQYKDYSEWQKSKEHQDKLLKQKEFWMNEFSEIPEGLNLPHDYKRPAIKSFDGGLVEFKISEDEVERLQYIAKEEGASLYMVFLTLFKIFLSKISNQEDIVTGTVASGRQHPDLEYIIGMFVNTIVLRSTVKSDYNFKQFLQVVKARVLSALDNQGYQYEDLLNDLKLEKDMSRNPLFDVMFNYDSFENVDFQLPGLQMESYRYEEVFAKFDLTLTIYEKGTNVTLNFEYASSLFSRETIERFVAYFKKIVADIIARPEQQLASINLLSAEEQLLLHKTFNNTATDYAREKTLIDLFETQVSKSLKNVALIAENQTFSYSWLNATSNQLAHLLREKGISREGSVVVLMERRAELVVALFGILKSGGKYIPVETYLPDDRVKEIIESVDADFIITSPEHLLRATKIADVKNVFSLDLNGNQQMHVDEVLDDKIEKLNLNSYSSVNPPRVNTSTDLAYVIFTSGSTGKPKGVAVQHKPVINLIEWITKKFNIIEADKILLVSSISFDLSVYDIFGVLAAGGAVRIANKKELEEPAALAKIVLEEGITFWDSAPAMLQQVIPFIEREKPKVNAEAKLRLCFVSGDWIPLAMPPKMKSLFSNLQFIALGGATEATVWSNFYEVDAIEEYWTSVPYGKPIQNAKYFVLNKDLQLCPVGVRGDLYIGGECLATGYFNDEELTAKKFISSPLDLGEILYHTGDMARWFPDGNIEFLGRIDSQVKIRGYRIELGEIESRLLKFEGIDHVLAVINANNKYDKFICVYYVSQNEYTDDELRSFLRRYLPAYMLPKHFVHLNEIPLTKNGKVDRRLLPEPKISLNTNYIKKSETLTQQRLIDIWASLLNLNNDGFGVQNDFFDLGGHSIMAVHLINIIQEEFSVSIKLRSVFGHSTIEKMAQLIDNEVGRKTFSLQKAPVKKHYPASAAQERLYYEQLLNKENLAYNITAVFQIKGELDLEKIKCSFQKLVDRHDGLRTSFALTDNGVVQIINENVPFDIYISDTTYNDLYSACLNFIRPFDLKSPSLLRCSVVTLKENSSFLLVDIHHTVCDGISLNILVNDFKKIYRGQELEPLEFNYVDFISSQNGHNNYLEAQKKYWKNQLAGNLSPLTLPVIQDKSLVDMSQAAVHTIVIDEELYRCIKAYTVASNVSGFMFFLSAYYLLLSKISGNTDIIIASDVAGRTHPALKNVVGTFINILPLRAHISDTSSFREFLDEVKGIVLDAYDNQDYPFDQIISLLEGDNSFRKSVVGVHFSFANYLDSKARFDELDLVPVEVRGFETTQYELKIQVNEKDGGLSIAFIYSKALFDSKTIALFVEYYYHILREILSNDEIRIEDIELEGSVTL